MLFRSWSRIFKVVGVADGDTITVLRDKTPVKIRLHGVDAPEKTQAFGQKSKQFTSTLVFGKVVTVKVVTTDKYGRTVAEVMIGDTSLNDELVKAGLAWWYRKYAPRAKMIAFLEEEARQAKRGLWADPSPIAPWDFRQPAKPFSSRSPAATARTGHPAPLTVPRRGAKQGEQGGSIEENRDRGDTNAAGRQQLANREESVESVDAAKEQGHAAPAQGAPPPQDDQLTQDLPTNEAPIRPATHRLHPGYDHRSSQPTA